MNWYEYDRKYRHDYDREDLWRAAQSEKPFSEQLGSQLGGVDRSKLPDTTTAPPATASGEKCCSSTIMDALYVAEGLRILGQAVYEKASGSMRITFTASGDTKVAFYVLLVTPSLPSPPGGARGCSPTPPCSEGSRSSSENEWR